MIVARRAAVLAVALVLAGCGSAAPAGGVTASPGASQAAAATATPTPAPAPTPAPTATPPAPTYPVASPSPAATGLPISKVFSTEPVAISAKKLTTTEEALYANHPALESVVPQANLAQQLKDCETTSFPTGGQGQRSAGCAFLVAQDYFLYCRSLEPDALAAAEVAYSYALGLGLAKSWFDDQVSKIAASSGC